MAGQEARMKILYWSTKDNDKHCFKNNLKNKEIITVNSDHVEYAIDHFHNRVATVDVRVKRMHEGNYIETIVKHDINYKLEIATCYFENYGGLFTINKIQYTSFRLAD